MDCLLTAISSASGQLFIFATIAMFGPVVFTIIMTVRQVQKYVTNSIVECTDFTFVLFLGFVDFVIVPFI